MKNALISNHLMIKKPTYLKIKEHKENAMIGLDPTLSRNQACHKILAHHFRYFLKYETSMLSNTYDEVDSEVIHDMRVTVRRIESTLQIFKQDFKKSQMSLLKNSLKNMAHRLSIVRDLDVFMANIAHYRDKLGHESTLDTKDDIDFLDLMAYFKRQRKQAMKKIFNFLQSKENAKFKGNIDDFLASDAKKIKWMAIDKHIPCQIRHIAFSVVYRSYEIVRVHDESLKCATIDQLHDFRKDCKNLRYFIENFQDILGEESAEVLKEIKKVQDYLGELNDTKVSIDLMHYYFEHDVYANKKPVPPFIVVRYLAEVKDKQQRLFDGFPVFWHQINTTKLRRQLALAIAEL
jgi:CHAD domain-containing protein